MSLSNSDDDNENSIHFIDSNHEEFEYIEEEPDEIQPQSDHGEDDENTESYYTIEIEDDFDTDFEKDSLIA